MARFDISKLPEIFKKPETYFSALVVVFSVLTFKVTIDGVNLLKINRTSEAQTIAQKTKELEKAKANLDKARTSREDFESQVSHFNSTIKTQKETLQRHKDFEQDINATETQLVTEVEKFFDDLFLSPGAEKNFPQFKDFVYKSRARVLLEFFNQYVAMDDQRGGIESVFPGLRMNVDLGRFAYPPRKLENNDERFEKVFDLYKISVYKKASNPMEDLGRFENILLGCLNLKDAISVIKDSVVSSELILVKSIATLEIQRNNTTGHLASAKTAEAEAEKGYTDLKLDLEMLTAQFATTKTEISKREEALLGSIGVANVDLPRIIVLPFMPLICLLVSIAVFATYKRTSRSIFGTGGRGRRVMSMILPTLYLALLLDDLLFIGLSYWLFDSIHLRTENFSLDPIQQWGLLRVANIATAMTQMVIVVLAFRVADSSNPKPNMIPKTITAAPVAEPTPVATSPIAAKKSSPQQGVKKSPRKEDSAEEA